VETSDCVWLDPGAFLRGIFASGSKCEPTCHFVSVVVERPGRHVHREFQSITKGDERQLTDSTRKTWFSPLTYIVVKNPDHDSRTSSEAERKAHSNYVTSSNAASTPRVALGVAAAVIDSRARMSLNVFFRFTAPKATSACRCPKELKDVRGSLEHEASTSQIMEASKSFRYAFHAG
jgi:hypothetical protein